MTKNTPKDETGKAFAQEPALLQGPTVRPESDGRVKQHQYRPARLIGLYGRMP